MKKQYKAPLTQVVKINAEQMICDSPVMGVGGTFDGGPGDIQSKDGEDYGDLW